MSTLRRFVSALSLSVILAVTAENTTYVVNPDIRYQTIDGFGASDAWSMRFVGTMPHAVQSEVADLLFSSETGRDGNPKGIGLSIWRFNIGAGSV